MFSEVVKEAVLVVLIRLYNVPEGAESPTVVALELRVEVATPV